MDTYEVRLVEFLFRGGEPIPLQPSDPSVIADTGYSAPSLALGGRLPFQVLVNPEPAPTIAVLFPELKRPEVEVVQSTLIDRRHLLCSYGPPLVYGFSDVDLLESQRLAKAKAGKRPLTLEEKSADDRLTRLASQGRPLSDAELNDEDRVRKARRSGRDLTDEEKALDKKLDRIYGHPPTAQGVDGRLPAQPGAPNYAAGPPYAPSVAPGAPNAVDGTIQELPLSTEANRATSFVDPQIASRTPSGAIGPKAPLSSLDKRSYDTIQQKRASARQLTPLELSEEARIKRLL